MEENSTKTNHAYPEVTVGAFIFNKANQVLLCKSEKWNNQYVIPGGHVEKGESLETALRREIKEETGLEIFDIELISLQESIGSEHFHENRHFIFIDYLCKTDSDNVVLNNEATSFEWVDLNQVLDYDLGGFVRQFFTEYFNDQYVHKKHILYQYVKA